MKEKFRIEMTDFMPFLGKFPIGHKDSKGVELCAGYIVEYNNEKHFICYRYGSYMLKQPHTIHSIGLKSYEKVTKLNEVWAILGGEWLIIGHTDDPIYEQMKEIPEIQIS